jgi:hypothetical protein
MQEASSVERALTANNRLLEEKHIRVDRTGQDTTQDRQRSVFLGNLHFDVSEEEVRASMAYCRCIASVCGTESLAVDHERRSTMLLCTEQPAERRGAVCQVRAHFAAALEDGDAAVEAVRIVRDPESQRGKGFGFVLLKVRAAGSITLVEDVERAQGSDPRWCVQDKASVASALRLHESVLKGRAIRVTTCGKRTKRTSGPGGKEPRKKAGKAGKHRPSFEGRRATSEVRLSGGGDKKARLLPRLKNKKGPAKKSSAPARKKGFKSKKGSKK